MFSLSSILAQAAVKTQPVDLNGEDKKGDDKEKKRKPMFTVGKETPYIAAWLKVNEKPLTLVIEATTRSHYFSPLTPRKTKEDPSGLIGALLPGVQRCRELGNALAARAMLRVAEERFDDAWSDLLAC